MLHASDVLPEVGAEHVRKARVYLRHARRDLGQPGPLADAHREIDNAVRKLNELLKLAGALQQNDEVREALKEIIKEQEKLSEQTKDVGWQLLEGKLSEPGAPLNRLSAAQEGVADRVGKLAEMMKEAAAGTPAPQEQKQMAKAAAMMQQNKVGETLRGAARNIQAQNVVAGAMQQKNALQALKAIQAMLQGGQTARAGTQPGRQGMQPGQGTQPGGQGTQPGKGMNPGQGQGTGKGQGQGAGQGVGTGLGAGMGIGPGVGMGLGVGLGLAMNNQQGLDPKGGDRRFVKTAPAGPAVARDRSTWSSLGARERQALTEQYVQSLPAEYRELLRAYYEALAK